MKEKIIEISKIKIIGLIGLSLIFVFLGIWIAYYAPVVKIEILNNTILRKSIGFLSILFFGIMGILISKKLFENKYGIKINDNGIYDNSTAINSGLIKWENIERIEKSKVVNQNFIRIIVNNPNEFIERQTNLLTRKNVETNFKKFGSPIQISANGLKIRFNDLYELITEEFKNRK
ncbi:STM3941 family protein [Winogradskyella undariae]|uniref:STM3941 family protein n=1 Tax=Winogradskyella undariae TaxID=1285465 RepID=UPI0015CCD398|nr:STM3941 family protein [Winogradskyella undariae]